MIHTIILQTDLPAAHVGIDDSVIKLNERPGHTKDRKMYKHSETPNYSVSEMAEMQLLEWKTVLHLVYSSF